jgi:hypothetical protein
MSQAYLTREDNPEDQNLALEHQVLKEKYRLAKKIYSTAAKPKETILVGTEGSHN